VGVQSPPAIVQELRADEQVLATASGAAFVTAAQDRQRLIRLAAAKPAVAEAVMRLAPNERDDLTARLDLRKLSAKSPPLRARIRIGRPAPAAKLLAWYREAQARFGIHWQLLAAINFVESAFDKVRNTSTAGAQGPMQFEPATWRHYGLGGNVHDPHDAILGAANYLRASGGVHDARRALFAYNRSSLYVDAVIHLAHRIRADRDAFLEYYAWAVYVKTPTGYKRAPGP
jgi:membrane-bound lytic murein transglycosylase B